MEARATIAGAVLLQRTRAAEARERQAISWSLGGGGTRANKQ